MTRDYAEKELAIAQEESAQARRRMESAKTKSAWRKAGDDLEFWINRPGYFYGLLNLGSGTFEEKQIRRERQP